MKHNLVTLGHVVHWASIFSGLVASATTGNIPLTVISIAQVIHKVLDSVDTEKSVKS